MTVVLLPIHGGSKSCGLVTGAAWGDTPDQFETGSDPRAKWPHWQLHATCVRPQRYMPEVTTLH